LFNLQQIITIKRHFVFIIYLLLLSMFKWLMPFASVNDDVYVTESKFRVMIKSLTKSTILKLVCASLLMSSAGDASAQFAKKDDILQFTAGRWGAMSFTINGKIYAGGGYIGGSALNDWQEFDPATGKWTMKANMPGTNIDRSAGITFVANGKAYLGLGAEKYLALTLDAKQLTDLWEYDPALDKWTQKQSLPDTGRNASAVFVINNKAYVVGGETDKSGSTTNDVWEYDPSNNKWTAKGTYPGGHVDYATGFAINNKGYVFGGGGMGSTPNSKALYEYNGSAWTPKADFPDSGRQGCVVYVHNNKAYIGLGGGYSAYPKTFFSYDPVSDTWAFLTDKYLAPGRMFGRAEIVGTKVYIGLGWRLDGSAQTFFRDWWEADAAKLLGVDNHVAERNFMLYPNPSNGLVHVKTSGNTADINCNVYSIEGKLVFSGKLQNDNIIDLGGKPTGTYIFEMVADGQRSRELVSLQ
jgi:N-acetylneuraminic acid mutarotase